MLYWQPVGGLCVFASLRLCRFNEGGRWALSRAEFIEGSGGKGKGGRACICILFITVPPLGNAVATWCASPVVDAFGSRPGQQCKGRESGWRSRGNPLCTACWQSIRVRSGSGNPKLLRGAFAPGGGSKPSFCGRNTCFPRAAKLSPLSATNHPDMEPTHPVGAAFLLGHCSTCSRRQPRKPFSKSSEDSLDFFSGYTLSWEQCKAYCGRYPRLAGMWPGTSRKRSCSGPSLNSRHMPEWLSFFFDKQPQRSF
jgi:hypothetical protein